MLCTAPSLNEYTDRTIDFLRISYYRWRGAGTTNLSVFTLYGRFMFVRYWNINSIGSGSFTVWGVVRINVFAGVMPFTIFSYFLLGFCYYSYQH